MYIKLETNQTETFPMIPVIFSYLCNLTRIELKQRNIDSILTIIDKYFTQKELLDSEIVKQKSTKYHSSCLN